MNSCRIGYGCRTPTVGTFGILVNAFYSTIFDMIGHELVVKKNICFSSGQHSGETHEPRIEPKEWSREKDEKHGRC